MRHQHDTQARAAAAALGETHECPVPELDQGQPSNAEVLKAIHDLNEHLGHYHATAISDALNRDFVDRDIAASLAAIKEQLQRLELQ